MASNNRKAYTPNETVPVPISAGRKRTSWRQPDETIPTWDSVPAEVLAGIVRCLTTQGASPTFGYTRNGRALMLRVWYKGEGDVQYLTTVQEVRDYVRFLATEWFDVDATDLDYYALGEAERP